MLSHGLQMLFTDIPLVCAGLLLFVGAHGVIVARTFFSGKSKYIAQAHLPLEQEDIRHE